MDRLSSPRLRLLTLLPFFATLFCSTLAYTPLSDSTLKSLPRPGNDFDVDNGAILAPILRTRVPGTPGSLAVLEHFVTFFQDNLPDWNLEFQNSTSKTPITGDKDIPFVNLIVSRDPPFASVGDVGRLTLVAHYDSKISPEGFIGATDSAAPCAMIMHAIRSIDAALTRRWEQMEKEGNNSCLDGCQGIQVFFLDGEEAFDQWTEEDSLYGARSLADALEKRLHPALSVYKNALRSIELFVLLDLLGSTAANMPSYFKTTHWAYQRMADAEQRLRKVGQFKSAKKDPSPEQSSPNTKKEENKNKQWLSEASKNYDDQFYSGIGDDHVPFMKRGVDILHLIPSPFPRVWHSIRDNAEALEQNIVEDWSTLLTAFVAEWFDLEGHFDEKPDERPTTKGEKSEL